MDLCSTTDYELDDLAASVNAKEFCRDWWKSEDNIDGDCCCNCVWQQPINAHPWNIHPEFRGPVTQLVGWGCCPPDLYPTITFFEKAHGMCECHSRKR
jgi:hypothetical protein